MNGMAKEGSVPDVDSVSDKFRPGGNSRNTYMFDTCPKCGGTAILLETRNEVEEIADPENPSEKVRIPVKVEEFRCQDPSCEHEFERIIREPTE